MPVLNCPKCAGPKTQYDADHCDDAECPLKAVEPTPVRWAANRTQEATVAETLPKRRGRPAKS